MNLIQDVLAAAGGQENQDHFTRVPLADILPDEQNFYGLREIEELAASIEAFGLDQPPVVRPATDNPGKYKLTGGHRRRAALLLLAAKDPARWAEVDVRLTSSLGALADRARLIALNKTARKETEYEQMREVVELAEIAKAWKAQGGNVPGKLREAVAKSVGLSSAQVGKYQAIYNHLVPALMRSYEAGQIGTPVAFELCGLPKRQQEEIAAANPAPTLEQTRTAKASSKSDKAKEQNATPMFSGVATAAESQTVEHPAQSDVGNTTAAPVAPSSDLTTSVPCGTPAISVGQSAPTMGSDFAIVPPAAQATAKETITTSPAEPTDAELAQRLRACIDTAAGGTEWHNRLQAFFTRIYSAYGEEKP